MAQFDLPLDRLRIYAPTVEEPEDFDAFWSATLADQDALPLDVTVTAVRNGLALINTFNVTYAGFGGATVHAWLHVPAGSRHPLPLVVEYTGYASGRGLPFQNTLFAQAGYAHLIMDNRGQGEWAIGDTEDPASGGVIGGYMTRGILDPRSFYYRRLFVDAVRAVQAARTLALVDADRIVVAGASQGGGIALAVSVLAPGLRGAIVDIPFLCHFERALTMTDRPPYREVVDYLARYRDRADAVLRTLSYVDGVNFAARSDVDALYSVALMDTTCPPSTVYAAFNAHAGPKEMVVYPYNDHEGGAEAQTWRRLEWLAERFGPPIDRVESSWGLQ